jgi:hypothetical protein
MEGERESRDIWRLINSWGKGAIIWRVRAVIIIG